MSSENPLSRERQNLLSVARQTRRAFESGEAYSIANVFEFYGNFIPRNREDRKLVIARLLGNFPFGNCVPATLYLLHKVGRGEIIGGAYLQGDPDSYSERAHTFPLIDDLVVDITADQFGGPKVYVGPLIKPWVRD